MNKLTWDEIVRLYRLTMKAPPHKSAAWLQYLPPDPVDVVTEREGSRDFVRMRWLQLAPGDRGRWSRRLRTRVWQSRGDHPR
jgi:hypothetical protein